ncbi:MAG: trimeric intracellular cation channel family protein [Nitratireductor sp.]|nr:trimeric intracellular cation channel family protein [Nitratireductor sp.]
MRAGWHAAGGGRFVEPFQFLDYIGVAVFAATGALVASRKQLDLLGFVWFAAFTGIGGGTLRDLVLGQTPVFWVKEPFYLIVCALIGLIVFFTAHLVESRYRVLLWLDAVGIAAYCVMGAAKGLEASGSATVAIVTGMMTATFGGIVRDTIAGEKSVILRPEIYVTATLVGAAVFVLAARLEMMPPLAEALIAAFAAFAVRAGALHFGWTMPGYRARAGRTEAELQEQGIVRED